MFGDRIWYFVMDKSTEFHWAEGLKYATESIKSLFLLNGVAAISILTFVGNAAIGDNKLIYAMLFLTLGAITGPIAFTFAYLTQLSYGNQINDRAWSFHRLTYLTIVIGCLLFVAGITFVGCALINNP